MTTLPIKINIFLNNLKPDEPTGIPNGTKIMANKSMLKIYVKKVKDKDGAYWLVVSDTNGNSKRIFSSQRIFSSHFDDIDKDKILLKIIQREITDYLKKCLKDHKNLTPEFSLGSASLKFKIVFNQEECIDGDICAIRPDLVTEEYSCEILSDEVEKVSKEERSLFYSCLQEIIL